MRDVSINANTVAFDPMVEIDWAAGADSLASIMLRRGILLLPFAAGIFGTAAHAGKATNCPAVFHQNDLRLFRPRRLSLPERDRIPYPEARVTVTCTIGKHGRLAGCASNLRDERGPALASYVSHWRVLGMRVGTCPLQRRQLAVRFHIKNTE